MIVKISSKKEKITVKNTVIDILSENWPLSAKKIYSEVRKRGVAVTYQAVHKSLMEYVKDNVLERDDKNYMLSMRWVESTEGQLRKLRETYRKKNSLEILLNNGGGNIKLNSMQDLYRSIAEILRNFSRPVELCASLFHPWNFIASMDSNVSSYIEAFSNAERFYCTLGFDYPVDHFLVNLYKNIKNDFRFAFVSDSVSVCETVVVDDYVLYIYYPKDLITEINNIYQHGDVKSMDFWSILSLAVKDAEINIMVIKNSEIAKSVRGSIKQHFERAGE